MEATIPAKADLEPGEPVVQLVNAFYDQAKRDAILGPVFNTIIGDDWSGHLPVMYTFWESVVFGLGGYKGQAVAKHVEIDKKMPLDDAHFQHWIALWNTTVDALFAGPNADLAKSKANLMLQLIKFKVDYARSGKSLL